MTTTSTSSIFSLPTELRLVIWEHCMTDIPFPTSPDDFTSNRQTIMATKICLVPYKQPSILKVCKEIRAEALEEYRKPLQKYRKVLVREIKRLGDREVKGWDAGDRFVFEGRLAWLDKVLRRVDRELGNE